MFDIQLNQYHFENSIKNNLRSEESLILFSLNLLLDTQNGKDFFQTCTSELRMIPEQDYTRMISTFVHYSFFFLHFSQNVMRSFNRFFFFLVVGRLEFQFYLKSYIKRIKEVSNSKWEESISRRELWCHHRITN